MYIIFKIIGILFMLMGSYIGFQFVQRASYIASPGTENLFTYAGISYIAGSIIIGLLIMGFGRIIELLKNIETNTEVNSDNKGD